MVLRHGVGATVKLNKPAVDLLSETPGRVVVAIEAIVAIKAVRVMVVATVAVVAVIFAVKVWILTKI
jgi:hypothetical protein